MASADDKHTEILDIIEKRLIPDEAAKKARGEVFTPLNLVREMLYGLRKSDHTQIWGMRDGVLFDDDPEDRIGGIPLDVWRNPDSKWLDPANGIGNFPFVAFLMLDFQLSKTMKDATARKKHIVEKMLHMIEIDKGNVNTARKIFETLAPSAKSNICCADTLKLKKEDLVREFGVAEFDVIMGNPPFNTPRQMKGQTSTLWDKFLEYSINIVKPGGFVGIITPANWRRPESKLYTLVNANQLLFIHIIGKREGQKIFGATTRVDIYIIQKVNHNSNTLIIDENGILSSIDTLSFPFLPNYAFENIRNILIDKSEGLKVIFSSSIYEHRKKYIKKEKTEEYKYPIAHTNTQKGIGFLYTNDPSKGHFGVSKVLLNVNEQQYPVNDFEGKYGMSQLTFGIPISSKKEGDDIVTAINSDKFKEIIKATKWGAFQTDYRMFNYFKPDFYKEFLPKKSVIKSRKRTFTKARRSRQRAR
uniref:site-specific DNA-methyltransferase (adenine-specific) n=1 Tax=viral metagenome TaxID=1070528 RepID=A0A6C0K7Q2_9ZZZZ